MVRCVKITTHCSTETSSLLTFRSNPLSWQLSGNALSAESHACTHVHVFRQKEVCNNAASCILWSLPGEEVYLEKLTSLSFMILRNVKATLDPKTNLMLVKQKAPQKWGWPLEERRIKSQEAPQWHFHMQSFCLQLQFNHRVSVVTHLLTPLKKKFIYNPVTSNQSNYLCSFNNEKHSPLLMVWT